MALKQAMQRGAGQRRDGGLQGVEAVVERQEGVPAERHGDGLLLGAERGGSRLLRPHRRIRHKGPLAPFHDGLAVQPIALGELLDRSFRSLYRCSDGVRRRGAAMEYLAHSSSRAARDTLSPPHPGTEHLALNKAAIGVCWGRAERAPSLGSWSNSLRQ